MLNKLFAAIAALTVLGAAHAQTLTVGDPAPAFPVDGWVKGDPIKGLEKGNVYVIEFWATWCGPCIASMPHLSEIADQFKGKATLISVNTWDYGDRANPESRDAHVQRVTEWVQKNTEKMRYNIALDTATDTISTTWMRAAGRNGIPCAFIVNQEGKIAWIGHPMSKMEDVLEQVCNKTWDLEKFKKEFQAAAAKDAAEAAERAKTQKAINDAVKAGDMAAFEKACEKVGIAVGISTATNANPSFAMSVLEKYAGKIKDMPAFNYCSMAANIAQKSTDQAVKDRAMKLSADCYKEVPEKQGAIGAIYHARVLFFGGKKEDALNWAETARNLVSKYEPEQARENITKYIDQQVALFKK